MREIVFRAKSVSNNEWFYGSLVSYDSINIYILKAIIAVDSCFCSIAVKPETVGQYTGMMDKNSTKIFEGDIIKCWSEGVSAKGVVEQRKDGLWIMYPAWQKNIMWGLYPDETSHTSVEIIGNIHDNPELLNIKKAFE